MAQLIRYVNPDASDPTPDGTTEAEAYTSLNACEAAEEQDLDAGNNYMTIRCFSSAGTDDTTRVVFLTWTTSATDYIEIVGWDFPANGIFDGTKYVKYHNGTGGATGLSVQEEYVRVNKIQFVVETSGTTSSNALDVTLVGASNEFRVSNCIIKAGATMTGTGTGIGIRINDTDAIVKIWNCVVYGFISASDPTSINFRAVMDLGSASCSIFNCTVFGNNFGIRAGTGIALTAKNCAVFNNTDDWNGNTLTVDYCASDDADVGTNLQDFTAEATDWNAVFTDYANGDVTLKNYTTSPCAVGKGVDDPGAGLYSDDITGYARASTWDIGAFEYVSAGAAAGFMTLNTGYWGP